MKTYYATAANGTTFARTTSRTFTDAVIRDNGVVSFHQGLDRAMKAADTYGYDQTEIVPAVPAAL